MDTAGWLLSSGITANRAGSVINFRIDVKPSGFDRPVTKYFRDQVLSKLMQAGISTLTVIVQRGSHRELILRFDGPAAEVTRAKGAFDQE